MYNLEVDADHCYRVGEQGILVHNASSPCKKLGVLPGESMNLESQSVPVYRRTGLRSSPLCPPYNYLRIDKKVANISCGGRDIKVPKGTTQKCSSSDDRVPSAFMRELIQFGVIGLPNDTALPCMMMGCERNWTPSSTNVPVFPADEYRPSANLRLGSENDDVGHIIGNQFGGYANEYSPTFKIPGGRGNVSPQHGDTNRIPYRIFESTEVKIHVEDGCQVCMLWNFNFDKASNTPHRPTSFTVTWWIDDWQQPIRLFTNPL